MSVQSIETPAGGLGSFWRNVTGARRRVLPSRPEWPVPVSSERAVAEQRQQRALITAETLADSYIKGLAKGDYAYRVLKNEFDAFCEEAEIDRVADQKFGRWMKAAGGVKYRSSKAKITMYRIKPRRLARAA
jgi:hypothetical protein